ncbi:MAG: FkbM family methyltransferase [Acidobacteria bacterium]|nr:FkbM family methyltransferase [Acidobacteriota bacterium]MBI3425582.1 FkbM family methyltransferase [Acidobacteriota bacterium]
MHVAEKILLSVRHHKLFERAHWLWDGVRPLYDWAVSLTNKNGLQRIINESDRILILPRFRQMGEVYEPDVWQRLMSEIKPGDRVADVGAFIGLYTIAIAQRVGARGQVTAFEPDPINHLALQKHVSLNHLDNRVQCVKAAAGAIDGMVYFDAQGITGHVTESATSTTSSVTCVTLDGLFPKQRLDVLKIDVEGYEEHVLRGAAGLLSDAQRRPRVIYIEVHPYAWSEAGTTSDSLLGVLAEHGYDVEKINGEKVSFIDWYGEVIAKATYSN